MKDYRERIISRANILDLKLSETELETLNAEVNDRINNGTHEHDALDMAYFKMKNNK